MYKDWEKAKSIFIRALELPTDDRPAFVDKSCQKNPALKREVAELLAADSRRADFLERPIDRNPETLGATVRFAPGTTIGRYILVEELGTGGMGVVYKAYDPELDRLVAVKLLNTPDNKDNPTSVWLKREAQALARLSHPNVVSVYDVDAQGDQLFVAMELIEGKTLRDWLSAKSRSFSQILDIFCLAGEGLLAAHQAGLVHRDFKPSNVMVGDRGGVRVLDFGLARANPAPVVETAEHNTVAGEETTVTGDSTDSRGAPTLDHLQQAIGSAGEKRLLSKTLTQPGHIAGTPVYMAPEQLSGKKVDSRADQYSFCIALYEALYHQLNGVDKPQDQACVETIDLDKLSAKPAEGKIPSWIRQALVRGLAPDPNQRYGSMADLLAVLKNDPIQRLRRRMAILIGLLATVAMLSLGMWQLFFSNEITCVPPAGEFEGLWDEGVKQRCAKSFDASGFSFAQATYSRVEPLLDRYVETWRAGYTSACEDTHKHGRQSAAMLDARMGCLRRHRRTFEAFTKQLAGELDRKTITNAIQASMSLPPVDQCSAIDLSELDNAATVDTQKRTLIESLKVDLEVATTQQMLGKSKEGLSTARNVLEKSKELAYPPLVGGALYRMAKSQEMMGDYQAAVKNARLATKIAAFSKDVDIYTRSWSLLLITVGVRQKRMPEALELLELIDEQVLTWADNNPRRLAEFYEVKGIFHSAQGELTQARAAIEKSIDLSKLAYGTNHPKVAGAINNLGKITNEQGKPAEARTYFEQSLAILTSVYGSQHFNLAKAQMSLGIATMNLGDYRAAKRYLKNSLANLEENLGTGHVLIAMGAHNLADTLFLEGDYPEARKNYNRALTIIESILRPNHPDVARPLLGLGMISYREQDYQQAYEYQRQALSIRQAELGATHPLVGESLAYLGQTLLALNRTTEALRMAKKGLAVMENKLTDGRELAHARFILAQALMTTGGNKQQAVELARKAKKGFEIAGPAAQKELNDLEAWLQNIQLRPNNAPSNVPPKAV